MNVPQTIAVLFLGLALLVSSVSALIVKLYHVISYILSSLSFGSFCSSSLDCNSGAEKEKRIAFIPLIWITVWLVSFSIMFVKLPEERVSKPLFAKESFILSDLKEHTHMVFKYDRYTDGQNDNDELSLLKLLKCRKGVRRKHISEKCESGERYGKERGFFFQTVGHLFNFRSHQTFRQTHTACPATLNLTSHYASGSYGQSGSGLELQKEGVRLATFKDFPTTAPVSAIRLAQAGFFYTGERDTVKCFTCGVIHSGWQMGDKPALVHARISPNCPLVRGSDTNNLPLPMPVTSRPTFPAVGGIDTAVSGSRSNTSSNALHNGTATGTGASEMQTDSATGPTTNGFNCGTATTNNASLSQAFSSLLSAASNGPIPSSPATQENSMFSGAFLYGTATPMDGGAPRSLSMPTRRLDLSGAVYPLYSQMDARKRSFSSWVADQGLPSVEELIVLGFFYAGYADCVRCFYCGIGLKSWEPNDVPAEVHARWRPTCEYLRLVKGDEFVDIIANGGRNGTTSGGSGGGGGSNSGAPGNDGDLQRDAAEPDQEALDNVPPAAPAEQDPLQQRHNVLQQENARLRNMRTCQRCHVQPVGVIFLPCGHIIACTTCAPNIRRCLRCDTVIRATANVYFS